MNYNYINAEKIKGMLFQDPAYVQEFCEAGIQSFNEFIQHYRLHLLNRDMQPLRKAGHKIRPGAQMMGVDEVVEEYEHAKYLLQQQASQEQLQQSVSRMNKLCSTVKDELEMLTHELN